MMQNTAIFIFQSTPPVKAATGTEEIMWHQCPISIHAAREGGDGGLDSKIRRNSNFNPRRP